MGAGLQRAQAAARATQERKADKTNQLYDAVLAYLREHNWNAVTIGGTQIRQDMDSRKFNYEFVVRFTGSEDK